ncbi:hypothetical protein ACFL3C_02700 [Patescibacteria group bacterium]
MKVLFSYKKAILQITILIIATAHMAVGVLATGTSPMQVEYSGIPGDVLKGQVSIYNSADGPRLIYLKKNDFNYNDDTEDIVYSKSEDLGNSFTEWINLPQGPIYVDAKERKIIPYEISIPEGVESRGYYGALFIESLPIRNTSGSESSISGSLSLKLAHLVLLGVEGSLFENISLRDVVVQENDKSLELQVVMYNDGNVHSTPSGSVELFSEQGELMHIMTLNEGNDSVLPQHQKTFVAKCPFENFPAGTYYVALSGNTEQGKAFQTKAVLEITKDKEVILHEDDIENLDIDALRGAAIKTTQTYQAVASVLAIFLFALFFAYFVKCGIICAGNKRDCHFWWYKPKRGSKKGKSKKI